MGFGCGWCRSSVKQLDLEVMVGVGNRRTQVQKERWDGNNPETEGRMEDER